MKKQTTFSRRTLARGAAGAAGGLALVKAGVPMRAAAQDQVTVTWWDQFQPLEPLHRSIWEQYSADNPNVTVEYTVYNPNEMGQALQLAFDSEQMPDVHSLAGLGVPVEQLVAANWFTPMPNGEAIRAALPEGSLLEGFNVFNGDVYSFPLFTFRQHETLNWFNTQLLEDAGIDPATGPATWDEYREAARSISEAGGGQIFGWIQGLNFVVRLGNHVMQLAQAAGAPGPIDHRTGEYAYASDPFVQALEFLVSLQEDGSLFPASSGLDARTARARWATGVAGFFFDGPWNIGVVVQEFGEFAEQVGVGAIPTPNGGTSYIHVGPAGSPFFISSQTENAEVAADILQRFTTPEYYVGLAERMDQPPLDLSAVEEADVHPTYRRGLEIFEEHVRLAPSAIVRNPAVSAVNAEMQDITPDLGEIAQGAFSGDVTDIRAALQTFNDAMTAERDRAIQVVQDAGMEVSIDDWVFSNWDPAQDYTEEMYQAL